jgi:hypothetical protein
MPNEVRYKNHCKLRPWFIFGDNEIHWRDPL